MVEIKYEITEKIAVLSQTSGGWTKELNLVSWNDKPAKYDLRDWSPEHAKMGKGDNTQRGRDAGIEEGTWWDEVKK